MLSTGSRLGPYEVLDMLGAGGMGEVYRARDPRLGREVALKILPAAFSGNSDRLRRFEQEARAASALSHPNIVSIYDIGAHDGAPYIVSELLDGETVRERLASGPLPVRKTVDFALQIARGLAAAHEKGIVHRDLKPENLFITRDGHLKILDFGLAKLTDISFFDQPSSAVATLPARTEPGTIMGTAAYMSPEQVRGLSVDHRSDIFSFGSILYEMLTGRRAFTGDSAVETMNAILKEEPEEITLSSRAISPGLERIISHCLEKDPRDRFQSAYDLAFGLETLSDVSSPSEPARAAAVVAHGRSRRRWLRSTLTLGIIALLLATAFVLGMSNGTAEPPSFNRLTYRRGAIGSARFAPDGSTIVYSAQWEGGGREIFTTRQGSPESRSLELRNADVMAVSSTGELAIRTYSPSMESVLSRAPLGGGAPREVLQGVYLADWSPDGTQLAVARYGGDEVRHWIEYPIGNKLYETSGWIGDPRVSPDGRYIAFIDYPALGDDLGRIAVVDLEGEKTILTEDWSSAKGLAWSADGDEIWFTATDTGKANALRAVTLSGNQRLVARIPGRVRLHDIARDGNDRVLLAYENRWGGIAGYSPSTIDEPGDPQREEALAWLDSSFAVDITANGSAILIEESGEGGGTNYSTYLRKMDGSPAIRLGDGSPQGLSPDGQWALVMLRSLPSQLVLLPTGAGVAREVPRGPMEQYLWAKILPDGKRLLFAGREPGKPIGYYLQDLDGGDPVRLELDNAELFPNAISPDGEWIVGVSSDWTRFALYPIDGGDARPVAGLNQGDHAIRWSSDGRSLAVSQIKEVPAKVYWVDIETGRRQFWKVLGPADKAGVHKIFPIIVTGDGKAYAYSYFRTLSDLYLAAGLR